MKTKSIFWILFALLSTNVYSQAPEKINYQAIVRDVNNTVVANQSVSVKFVITESLPTGTVIYEENQTPTTNSHGLINLKIGTGAFVTGTLDAIDWSSNSYYLTTSIDPTGGTNYTLTGVSELVSVPYALHAKTVDNADDADADPNNEIQDLQLVGDDLSITVNGSATVIDLSPYAVDNDTQLTEAEVDAFANNNGYLTSEVDGSTTNEIQTLSVVGSTATLSLGGGSISINDADFDATNEIQNLSYVSGTNTISISGGNSIVLTDNVDDADASATNEIQSLSYTGNQITISGSNTITLTDNVNDADADATNEIQNLSYVSGTNTISISGGNSVVITDNVDDADANATNEIQTLSITGNDLTISGTGGNTVTLPSSGGSSFAIGQYHEGGIIVFIDSTGLHGLIVAESDLGSFQYQNGAQTQIGATSYTDGAANTTTLAGGAGNYDAADACDTYTGGGQTDWYLPSYTEFILIYNNLYSLGGFDYNVGIYWTSTMTSVFGGSTGAAYFLSGSANMSYSTNTSALVRPMRQF